MSMIQLASTPKQRTPRKIRGLNPRALIPKPRRRSCSDCLLTACINPQTPITIITSITIITIVTIVTITTINITSISIIKTAKTRVRDRRLTSCWASAFGHPRSTGAYSVVQPGHDFESLGFSIYSFVQSGHDLSCAAADARLLLSAGLKQTCFF